MDTVGAHIVGSKSSQMLVAVRFVYRTRLSFQQQPAPHQGCIDSVEWNSGTVEWWNSGMVGWSIDDPLLLYRCHSNKHACAFWCYCNFSVRGRYSYDRLLVPGHGVSSSPTLLEIDDSFTSVADRI